MFNLKKQSGLPMSFENGGMLFNAGIASDPVQARTLEAARPYLMDAHATARRKNLYLMYRDVHEQRDEAIFRKHGIRYDITVIAPGTIGGKQGEYIRTIGHTHPTAELYEVLNGTALFALQEIGDSHRTIFIRAERGAKLIVPPGFGHITINIGKDPLILADLFKDDIKSDYSFFKKHRGAAYWVRAPKAPHENMVLSRNPRYKQVGETIIGTPADYAKFGLSKKDPIYASFVNSPKRFAFLAAPGKAWKLLDEYGLCYAE